MKKSVSLKLIVFSLLLVAAGVSYSEPKIEAGTGPNSTKAGLGNTASNLKSSAFGNTNSVSGEGSSAFGSKYKVTGEASGAFGVGEYDNVTNTYKFINEGNNSYMIGNKNKIASGSNNNFILGNNVSIGSGIQNSVALGNGSTVSSSNEVSVGSATQKRKITNVADGSFSYFY